MEINRKPIPFIFLTDEEKWAIKKAINHPQFDNISKHTFKNTRGEERIALMATLKDGEELSIITTIEFFNLADNIEYFIADEDLTECEEPILHRKTVDGKVVEDEYRK